MHAQNPVSRSTNQPIDPYAAPAADISFSPIIDSDVAAAEAVRKEHIGAESNLKSLGSLMILGGCLLILLGAGPHIVALLAVGGLQNKPFEIGLSVIYLVLVFGYLVFGMIQFNVGEGLRRLENRSRVWACILMIPVFFLPTTWLFLYWLMNKKARFVCTPEYASIIEQTLWVKYKPSIIVKILRLLLFAFLMIMWGAILSSMQRDLRFHR